MIITDGVIITWEKPNRILDGYAIKINEGVIEEIGFQKEIVEKYPDDERLSAKGRYILPGNICAHTHFYGAYSRGMAIPGRPSKDFPEILQNLWWPLDKALNEEGIRYSAYVCLLDAIKHGTTTLVDHHASQSSIEGSLDIIAGVVDELGLRACLCYEVTDRDGEERSRKGIQENLRFIDQVYRNKLADGRLSALFGLHASLTLSEETLEICRQSAPANVGFHIHVAEHFSDQDDSLNKSGMRVIDRLYKHGILGPNSIAVHAVHVDAREIELLAETQTWVTHQPRSNMNNAVGMADIDSMLRMGIPVCLGNDGFSNAMWEEWKAAYLAHKLYRRDPRAMPGDQVAEMAMYNNSKLAAKLFDGVRIGAIVPGGVADIIFVDYQPFTPLTAGNLPWHIIFGFHESMVTHTIVAGKVIMDDRVLIGLDEEKLARDGRKIAPEIWANYNKIMESRGKQ
ncbi:MAG: putative aminohydrolase SsnA [Anaerolineae bacterium]|nr:putative aminohydrolase SsnA [Anaerolineae bacterium]